MCLRHDIEAIDRTLKDTMCSMHFGGKAVLFMGDCRQILPEIPRGPRARITSSCPKRGPMFPFLKVWNCPQTRDFWRSGDTPMRKSKP